MKKRPCNRINPSFKYYFGLGIFLFLFSNCSSYISFRKLKKICVHCNLYRDYDLFNTKGVNQISGKKRDERMIVECEYSAQKKSLYLFGNRHRRFYRTIDYYESGDSIILRTSISQSWAGFVDADTTIIFKNNRKRFYHLKSIVGFEKSLYKFEIDSLNPNKILAEEIYIPKKYKNYKVFELIKLYEFLKKEAGIVNSTELYCKNNRITGFKIRKTGTIHTALKPTPNANQFFSYRNNYSFYDYYLKILTYHTWKGAQNNLNH